MVAVAIHVSNERLRFKCFPAIIGGSVLFQAASHRVTYPVKRDRQERGRPHVGQGKAVDRRNFRVQDSYFRGSFRASAVRECRSCALNFHFTGPVHRDDDEGKGEYQAWDRHAYGPLLRGYSS